ncbi:hypothetical protein JTE90_016299 [Oedothorax gibbosus]|uniref:DDE Tnp4 domain-containing protein n=1 Tax=Oedothorax gibbosus TaxID=931172 RepID=A0AAV6TNZ6_9ARAC|nr:hypothetical protein JTE90_016299 [Oedothorax gibbosus]
MDWGVLFDILFNINVPSYIFMFISHHLTNRSVTFIDTISVTKNIYKGAPHFSIVLLAVVDANYQFVVADVGSKGRFSDGGIFATSALGHHFRNRTLGIPEDRSICEGGSPMPHMFVADEAFPLQRHLMHPFPGTQLDDIKRIFNYRLSRARRIVENAFGILSARFRVYRRPFECKLETVDKVVKATVMLHNYLGRTGGHNYSDEDISKAMQETDNQLLNLPSIGKINQVRPSSFRICFATTL